MIKLTDKDGYPLFVNPDLIVYIERLSAGYGTPSGSSIYLVDCAALKVRQSPEEVFKLVEQYQSRGIQNPQFIAG